jgi:hypothetical protein
MPDPKYDIAISFAGEDREFVRQLVGELVMLDMSVFYDEFEEADLWGKDLYEYLSKVYSKEASFCIMVISDNYLQKNWTRHERRAAQSRAFEDNKEYILPIRLGDVDVPGVLTTTGYIDATKKTISEIANLAKLKVKSRYIEGLNNVPEITFNYESANCILVPVKSNNKKLNNRIAFLIYSLGISNVCTRKLTLTNFELSANIGGRTETVSHHTPRLSMIDHKEKMYFPNQGELLLINHQHGNIVLQN